MIKFYSVNDINDSRIDVFTRLNEPELLHYYEPNGGVFIAESPNVVMRALNAGYEPVSLLLEEKHVAKEASSVISFIDSLEYEVSVYTMGSEELSRISGFNLTRGVLCAMRRREMNTVKEISEGAHRIVVLEDVVNPTNVGAIFRSAAALSMDGVLLTSKCADPLYRRAARVSMGTVFQIPWTYFPESVDYLEILKKQGFKTVAMALSDNSYSIDDPILKDEERLAIILGSEGPGLNENTISSVDYVVKIPMNPLVDSLNVAAASAVAFWELRRG